MTEKNNVTAALGSVVNAKHVVRPDGRSLNVSGGYVLDVAGVHVIDGTDVEVA